MISLFLILLVGFSAGCLSGVIGTGSSLMLLPVLTYQFGPKHAVPVMAIAAVIANVARVTAWWRDIDWKAVLAYAITGVPAAALGARTLLALPSGIVEGVLGLFFLSMLLLRRIMLQPHGMPLWGLSICGAGIGYLTGLVLSTGPLSVPAFAAYGLSGGSFLGTEAASSLALYVSKIVTFRASGALSGGIIIQGVTVGASLMVGTYAGKAVVNRLAGHSYQKIIDLLMLVSGMTLLWEALARYV